MLIVEFVTPQEAQNGGFEDIEANTMERRSMSKTRLPKLFLKDLNRLKKMRAQKKLEALKRQDLLGIMYGAPLPEEGGGGFGAPSF